MPDPTPDPISLEDQVKAITAQLKQLAGDLNRRFEQLNDRIDQQKTSFDALNQALSDLAKQSVAHRVSLPLTPHWTAVGWAGRQAAILHLYLCLLVA